MNKQIPTNTRDPVAAPAALPDAFYRNAPVSWKGYSGGERCVVDKVLLTSNDDAACVVKVLVRHTRRPELGDKFSSRHGQKGVVGSIWSQVGTGGWRGTAAERGRACGWAGRGRRRMGRCGAGRPVRGPTPTPSLTPRLSASRSRAAVGHALQRAGAGARPHHEPTRLPLPHDCGQDD